MAGFLDLLMFRLIVTVWIGIVAICGASPWDFLGRLPPAGRYEVIGLCLGFATAVRCLEVSRRVPPSRLHTVWRALLLTGWGWLSGVGLVWVFTCIYATSIGGAAEAMWAKYWAVVPSIGSAVGVLVQELWEERPISEPL